MAEYKKKSLDELDKELLRLKLERPGRTNVDLAALVSRSWRDTIRRTSRPEFQAAIKEYQKKAIDIVIDAKEKALRKIVKLIDSEDERVALKAAALIGADLLPAKKVDVAHSGSIGVTVDSIDWQKLTTDQLIRLKSGESPELIIAELSRN